MAMPTLDAYIEEGTKDTTLATLDSFTNFQHENIETSCLHGKWLAYYVKENLIFKKLRNDMAALRSDKRDYYLGRASAEVYKANPFGHKVTRSEVDDYVNADSQIRELQSRIDYLQEKINYISGIIENVKNRSWLLKTQLDYMKFTTGNG